ncbi:MAG: 7-carboxy-7-deazaguanine synthase QueE [Puniceicoccales bacterium]|jgi:organic radical activating enzyme|nr:7-carboxy-7-deazaguanine synthase QueE [Puniceicoccales bacterium]
MTYPVHEIFRSFQGEGTHAGAAAGFVRLAGCPIGCPWCDSADTWNAAAPKLGRLTPAQILAALDTTTAGAAGGQGSSRVGGVHAATAGAATAGLTAAPPSRVIITGGEPAIHDLAPLCDALRARGTAVHLETCGAFPLRGAFDWITVSPKWRALPLAETLARANELKLIITAPDEIRRWFDHLATTISPFPIPHFPFPNPPNPFPISAIYLHPEWSRRADPVLLAAIADWVSAAGDPWRAGWQIHKNYNAR